MFTLNLQNVRILYLQYWHKIYAKCSYMSPPTQVFTHNNNKGNIGSTQYPQLPLWTGFLDNIVLFECWSLPHEEWLDEGSDLVRLPVNTQLLNLKIVQYHNKRGRMYCMCVCESVRMYCKCVRMCICIVRVWCVGVYLYIASVSCVCARAYVL